MPPFPPKKNDNPSTRDRNNDVKTPPKTKPGTPAGPMAGLKAALPSGGGMMPMMGGAPEQAAGEDQEDQSSAGYMPPEDGPFQCGHCAHFLAPNACEIVSGMIDAAGCCNYYQSVETGKKNPGGEQLEKPVEEGSTIAGGGPSPYGR